MNGRRSGPAGKEVAMTEEGALLQAILDAPDEDVPRLVYADWLEERGAAQSSARAEFIRVQLALEQLPEDDERRTEVRARAQALLAEHEQAWVGPLRQWVRGWEFRRGLVERVEIDASVFLARADELFRLAPIRGAWLRE